MLKDSLHARVFIRISILLLRAVAPLSILYCSARVLWPSHISLSTKWLWFFDIFASTEALFYLAFYLPRKTYLNRPSVYVHPLASAEQRREAFLRCWDSIYDTRAYISQWFHGAAIEDLGSEDIKGFFSAQLWNRTTRLPEDEAELNEYLAHTELVLQTEFLNTRSENRALMVIFEPLNIKHRPMLWYTFFIGSADFQCWCTMKWMKFDHYRLSLPRQLLGTFPFRPWTLMSSHRSPSSCISYWHKPHTAKTQLPIVILHGLGVGWHFYLPFFARMLARNPGVGILAIEIMHVCSRVTYSPPSPMQITEEILKIMRYHKYSRCILLTHSYGSAIAAHLLRHPSAASMMHHLVFADPVAFSFHTPNVSYNFLRRPPTTASEFQLEYFASTDPDVAHTLTRDFNWTENSLWRDEIEDRMIDGQHCKTTVLIGGRDIITDTLTLGRYLTRRQDARVKWYRQPQATEDNDAWKRHQWNGADSLEVVWCPELNHAEVFEDVQYQSMLVEILGAYSKDYSGPTVG